MQDFFCRTLLSGPFTSLSLASVSRRTASSPAPKSGAPAGPPAMRPGPLLEGHAGGHAYGAVPSAFVPKVFSPRHRGFPARTVPALLSMLACGVLFAALAVKHPSLQPIEDLSRCVDPPHLFSRERNNTPRACALALCIRSREWKF